MEALNALVRLADSQNLFQRLDPLVKDRLFLYADDVILFTAARQQDLVLTRGILEMFAADAGLHTNVDKCLILESTVAVAFSGQVISSSNQVFGHSVVCRKA